MSTCPSTGSTTNGTKETFPGPVCCDSDRNGTLFFTDEHANKVVTLDTTGAVTNHWGETR